jgi:hypothetical protein
VAAVPIALQTKLKEKKNKKFLTMT